MGPTMSFIAALFLTWPNSHLLHPRLRGSKQPLQQSAPVGRITSDLVVEVPFKSWSGWLVEEELWKWTVNQSSPGPPIELVKASLVQIKEKILPALADVVDKAELQSEVSLNSISFADTCDTNMTVEWSQANVTSLAMSTDTNASLSGGWSKLTIAPFGQVSLQYQMAVFAMVTAKKGAEFGSSCEVYRKMQVPMLVGTSWLREVSWKVTFSEPRVEESIDRSRSLVYVADLAFEERSSNFHLDSVHVLNRSECTIKVGFLFDICNDFRDILKKQDDLLMDSTQIRALWPELVKKLALDFHVPVAEVAMPLRLQPAQDPDSGSHFWLAAAIIVAAVLASAAALCAAARRRPRGGGNRPEASGTTQTWR